MSIPIQLTPKGDPDKTEGTGSSTSGQSSGAKTTAPMSDDGSRKPFKQVLDTAMAGKELKKPSKVTFTADDDDDEKVTLLELAAQTKIRESKKPTITETAVFRQDAPVESDTESTNSIASNSVDMDDDVSEEISDADLHPISKGLLETVSKDIVKTTSKDTQEPVATDDTPKTPKVADKKATDQPMHVAVRKDEHAVARKVDGETKVADKIEAKVTFHEALGHKVDPNNVIGLSAPHVVHAANVVAPANATAKVSNVREVLMKLAQSMVDKIQEVKTPGRTDTTLTLTYPPMFEGVKIKITEYDSSQKQFNLTFSDVNNPTARALISDQSNQIKLQQALLDRGYTMQMVTVEQKIPGLASTETGEATLRQPGHQDGGQAGSATDQDEGNVT